MPKEGIILLHGILRTSRSLNGLTKYLKNCDFDVLNIEYPSTKFDLAGLADQVHKQLNEFCLHYHKVHFVGFSMGGLVIRAYLNKFRPSNLGRVVMIGTPNNGSEIADSMKNNLLYKNLFGKSGQQLITDQSMFKEIFGTVDYELGVIAGISSLSLLGKIMIKQESDGRVSIASTKVEGMKEHFTIKSGHSSLLLKKQVYVLVLNFITKGKFNLKMNQS